jgi:hypothetical protein
MAIACSMQHSANNTGVLVTVAAWQRSLHPPLRVTQLSPAYSRGRLRAGLVPEDTLGRQAGEGHRCQPRQGELPAPTEACTWHDVKQQQSPSLAQHAPCWRCLCRGAPA